MDSPSLRRIAWSNSEPFGAEFADVDLAEDRLRARGVAIGSEPCAYRLDYELETASGFVTTRFFVTTRGDGWSRSLELRRTPSGLWREGWSEIGAGSLFGARPATNLGALAGALDVDLGRSPLLNTPPVLRHGLVRRKGALDLVMAWVSVPDLAVHPSRQRYAFVRAIDDERSLVRFESLSGDGFRADLTYDREGFVLEYPGVGTRIPRHEREVADRGRGPS